MRSPLSHSPALPPSSVSLATWLLLLSAPRLGEHSPAALVSQPATENIVWNCSCLLWFPFALYCPVYLLVELPLFLFSAPTFFKYFWCCGWFFFLRKKKQNRKLTHSIVFLWLSRRLKSPGLSIQDLTLVLKFRETEKRGSLFCL